MITTDLSPFTDQPERSIESNRIISKKKMGEKDKILKIFLLFLNYQVEIFSLPFNPD